MIDISIILPSLREQAAISFIDWVNRQSIPYSYEIILVAPFNVERRNVVWVEDFGPHNGSIRPINDGVLASRGQFISIASDDTPYDIGWYTIIDFIKRLDPHRKLRIAGYNKTYLRLFKYVYKYPVLRKLPWLTKYHAQSHVHGIYFPALFCLDRKTVHLLGGSVFRKEFLAFYADPDLGMRLYEAGEPIEFCPSARVICSVQIVDRVYTGNLSNYWSHDRETFNSFWKDKYGEPPLPQGRVNYGRRGFAFKILTKIAEKVLLIPIVKGPLEKVCLFYALRRLERHSPPSHIVKVPFIPIVKRAFERVCLFYAVRRLKRHIEPRRTINVEISERNLTDIKRILDNKGARFWLMFGTFLGAYRDKALIPYEKNTDLAIYVEELLELVWCEVAFAKEGFQLGIDTSTAATLSRDGEHTDIYLFYQNKSKRVWGEVRYNVSAFETYNEIQFLGENFRILSEPERWLKYTYGEDWKKPIKGKGVLGYAYGEEFEST